MTKKQELLDTEEREWRVLCDRFGKIRESAWMQPGAAGEWSAKDVMAHVASWHAETAMWLERWRVAGERPQQIDFEEMNRDFHDRCREMTVAEVHAMSGAARHRMREELATMDDELSEGWARLIATCTFAHYAEHYDDLDRFIRTAGA